VSILPRGQLWERVAGKYLLPGTALGGSQIQSEWEVDPLLISLIGLDSGGNASNKPKWGQKINSASLLVY